MHQEHAEYLHTLEVPHIFFNLKTDSFQSESPGGPISDSGRSH